MVRSLKTDEQILQQSQDSTRHLPPINAISKFALSSFDQRRLGPREPSAMFQSETAAERDPRGRPGALQLAPLDVSAPVSAVEGAGVHAGVYTGTGVLRASFGLGSAVVGVRNSAAAGYVPSPTAALRSTVKPTVRTHAL